MRRRGCRDTSRDTQYTSPALASVRQRRAGALAIVGARVSHRLEGHRLVVAERDVEPVERRARSRRSRHRQGDRTRDRGELERQSAAAVGSARPAPRPRSPPTSILAKARHAVLRRSARRRVTTGTSIVGVPHLALPPAARRRAARTKSRRRGGHRGVGGVDVQPCAPGGRAAGRLRPASPGRRRRRASAGARRHSGCGSTATTRAPRRRKLPMWSPTWEPMSKTRSPAVTNRAVERVHPRVPLRVAVVDIQRPVQEGHGRIGPERRDPGLGGSRHLSVVQSVSGARGGRGNGPKAVRNRSRKASIRQTGACGPGLQAVLPAPAGDPVQHGRVAGDDRDRTSRLASSPVTTGAGWWSPRKTSTRLSSPYVCT